MARLSVVCLLCLVLASAPAALGECRPWAAGRLNAGDAGQHKAAAISQLPPLPPAGQPRRRHRRSLARPDQASHPAPAAHLPCRQEGGLSGPGRPGAGTAALALSGGRTSPGGGSALPAGGRLAFARQLAAKPSCAPALPAGVLQALRRLQQQHGGLPPLRVGLRPQRHTSALLQVPGQGLCRLQGQGPHVHRVPAEPPPVQGRLRALQLRVRRVQRPGLQHLHPRLLPGSQPHLRAVSQGACCCRCCRHTAACAARWILHRLLQLLQAAACFGCRCAPCSCARPWLTALDPPACTPACRPMPACAAATGASPTAPPAP